MEWSKFCASNPEFCPFLWCGSTGIFEKEKNRRGFCSGGVMGIPELIFVSRRFGSDANYVVAGGGNTSWKTEEEIYIKGSGFALETIG
jgi:rhamnose utilization protein RhaD (predicted bifunctional aldolase and dehydrogenase)